MSSSATPAAEGQLQDYSVDQAAGAVVLVLGAVAGLLQVIWMSKCHCKVNLCYLFRCERRPPSEEEMKSLKKKTGEILKKEDKILKKEDQILEEVIVPPKSGRSPTPSLDGSPSPSASERERSPWRRL
tara:strand:+ start:4758 stop:5141 length:384 start_codon:yes stop_codon:yes gene_type:complete